jgi:Flp pilus assembly pilin Flp
VKSSRSAVGLVEYSLIVSLVAVALIIVLALVGTGVVGVFQNVLNGLTGNAPPATNSLVVNITNLDIAVPGDLGPSVLPAVTVNGPGGYTQALTASTTLSNLTPGTYTVTANPVVATPAAAPSTITFYPTVTPASVSVPSAAHTTVVNYINAIPSTTHYLAGADLALLTALSGDITTGYTLTFSASPSFGPIQVGDVFVVGIGPLTPDGLQLKVTAVSGNTVSAATATFAEVFARADFVATGPTTSRTYSFPLLSSLNNPHAAPPITVGCGNTQLHFSGTFTIYDHPVFTFKVNWSWWGSQSGDQFGLTLNETDSYNVAVDTDQVGAISCQVNIQVTPPQVFATEPLPIPVPFPIIITEDLGVNASLNIGWQPTTHPWFTLVGDNTTAIGFLCDSSGCHGTNSATLPTPSIYLNGTGEYTAKFGPRMNVKVDGVAGIYLAMYVYHQNVAVPNLSPTCSNGELGLAISTGMVFGIPLIPVFANLWSFQLAEIDQAFGCTDPPFPPAAPSLIPASAGVDPRGCDNGNCGTGNTLGPGQIQFNPDNSLPRGTPDGSGSITADLPFINIPAGLHFGPNVNNTCSTDPEPNGPGTGSFCPFGLLVFGRTFTAFSGAQLGRWSIADTNGQVYLPPTDTVLFGRPAIGTDAGCGGTECVDGGQFNAYCRSTAGVKESCYGHTLVVQIWPESNGKASYSSGGSANFGTQPMSWFDGILGHIASSAPAGLPIIFSNPAADHWTCVPADRFPIYNSPC